MMNRSAVAAFSLVALSLVGCVASPEGTQPTTDTPTPTGESALGTVSTVSSPLVESVLQQGPCGSFVAGFHFTIVGPPASACTVTSSWFDGANCHVVQDCTPVPAPLPDEGGRGAALAVGWAALAGIIP